MIRIIPHCFRWFQILTNNSALFRKVKINRKIILFTIYIKYKFKKLNSISGILRHLVILHRTVR